MRPNFKVDNFLNSKVLSTSIFLASGSYATYKDYNNASPQYKDKFLIKNSVILSGASLGMLANHKVNHTISNSKNYKKVVNIMSKKLENTYVHKSIKTPINYTKKIAQEVISGVMTAFAGITGALGADYILSKTKFEQPIEIKKENKTSNKNIKLQKLEKKLEKYTDEEAVDVFYSSVTEMPKLKFIGAGMIGSDAIDIAKNKSFDDKLNHTTGYLINDTLIPILFLSTSSVLTQNFKTKYRIPTTFLSLFIGTYLTHKLFDKYTEKLPKAFTV